MGAAMSSRHIVGVLTVAACMPHSEREPESQRAWAPRPILTVAALATRPRPQVVRWVLDAAASPSVSAPAAFAASFVDQAWGGGGKMR